MKGAILIKNIANAHPERVRLLYRKYSISAPVSPQSLSLAIVAHGEPFINDLARIVAQDKAMVGTDGTTPSVEKSWFDKFKEAIKGFGETLEISGDIWGSIQSIFGMDTQLSAKEQAALNLEMYRYKSEQDRLAAQQRTMIFAIAGVAVFAVIALIIFKK
jgi:hypothetical protein